jgi:hypothetical protein
MAKSSKQSQVVNRPTEIARSPRDVFSEQTDQHTLVSYRSTVDVTNLRASRSWAFKTRVESLPRDA